MTSSRDLARVETHSCLFFVGMWCAGTAARTLPTAGMRPVRMYATGRKPTKNDTSRGRDQLRQLMRAPLPAYSEWVRGDGERFRYPTPGRGPHWIGPTPFPMNPSFLPPPPVHQDVRDSMWRLHTQAPKQWTVRSLSDKFRVSLERTEAILRLKALEQEFTDEVRIEQAWQGWSIID